MADTVKSRATRYAMDIARRKFDTQDQKYLRKQAKVTPSLLALARINLACEAKRAETAR